MHSTQLVGTLAKMKTALGDQVEYRLPVGDERLDLNPFLGKPIKLTFTEQIFCTHCGRKTKKSFDQGYCYPCFRSLAFCAHSSAPLGVGYAGCGPWGEWGSLQMALAGVGSSQVGFISLATTELQGGFHAVLQHASWMSVRCCSLRTPASSWVGVRGLVFTFTSFS